MAKVYKTAMGKTIDMDMIRLANETSIAIGNMKTNARGDELGQGGKIVKTRAQIMQEYYALNAPVADNTPLSPTIHGGASVVPQFENPVIIPESQKQLDDDLDGGVDGGYIKPRGSLADTVAQSTEVNQTLLEPIQKSNGIQRI
jgi:hypothetical protein